MQDSISLADTTKYLTELKQFIGSNKSAQTSKQISTKLSIPIDFVKKFFEVLTTTDYFKVETSPSGRFKRAVFNKFSKRIYFRNNHCALERGREVLGNCRDVFYSSKLSNYEKRLFLEFEDKARRDGVFLVNYDLKTDLFVDIFIKEMGFTFDKAEKDVDEFEKYPLVKAEIEKYSILVSKLEKEVKAEIALNESNAKWYEEEYYKASIGKRRKDEAYSVIVGEERVVGVTYNRYWFDDEPTREYTESFVPKYETRYRSVVNWPEKPEELTEKQREHNPTIKDYNYYLKELSDNRITYEKRLAAELDKAKKLQELEKQKKEIEQKIKQLY